MTEKQFLIYGDGACSGNPGPGGYGSIILFPDGNVQELAESFPKTTNNRMEISAILEAFKLILQSKHLNSVQSLQIFTDSVYLIRGSTQWLFGWKKKGWKGATNEPIANPDLWQEMDQVLFQFKTKAPCVNLEWNFVKGHAGIPGNERCDQLAVAMSKNTYIDLYHGKAENYHFDIFNLPEKKPLPEAKKADAGPKKPSWYLSLVNGTFKTHKTWSECEAVVKGRPGVKFKKVSSDEEEAQIKKQWGI
ncbi:MAG: ribonuclease HI [Bdellovibrio sp.]|nr:ribonuclease HI [Bdellovibrio sp.]